jgi:hypothetical protein
VLNIIGFNPPKDRRNSFMTSDWEKEHCHYSFSWEKLAWLFNDVVDRGKASDDLVAHVVKKASPSSYREIVLVGHSHGGNVAIQAADRLAEQYDKVYIITIATPAQNRETIDLIYEIIAFKKYFIEIAGGYYVYKNPENPVNLKKKNIVHYALWNDKDTVDELALRLDSLTARHGMTSNSAFFENNNGITKNVKFSIDVKTDIKSDEILVQWMLKLNALYKALYQYCVDGYQLPPMPPLRTFSEYRSETKEVHYKEEYHTAKAYATYVVKPLMRPINTVRTSQLLRTGDFGRLFKDLQQYTEFLNRIDGLSQPVPLPSRQLNTIEEFNKYNSYTPRILQSYAGFNQIAAMFTEPNIKRYREYDSMVRTGSYPDHGFDLAKPSEIQKAIDDGRIKPFERVERSEDKNE